MSRPTPGVLSDADAAEVRAAFGVGDEQVRRDHVISHVLAVIACTVPDGVVFFGGTALSRTFLPAHRLSEDIDLLALGDRDRVAEAIDDALTTGLRHTLGQPEFRPPLAATRHPDPAVMAVASTRIQIQLLGATGYPSWPKIMVDIEQRYRDAPAARLRVPTPAGFAAAKLAAWHDRHAPRDLYDLWGLADRGMIDDNARTLFQKMGPLTDASTVSFDAVPTEREWTAALGHQCIPRVTPAEAANRVRAAWAR